MKTYLPFCILLVTVLTSVTINAQCVDQLQTITYDTTVTGSGNDYKTLTFPKFDPSTGTLTEVIISTDVTLQYSFQLENKENLQVNNYRVRVVRDDEISGSALQMPLSNTYQQTYGYYSLAAQDGVTGSGPDYTSQGPLFVMNHNINTYTVYNTADYMGIGTVDLDYSSTTYSIVFGSVNNNFNGTAEDAALFSITYKYCPAVVLDADIISFTAVKKNEPVINLQWITQNEINERIYELQKSPDGRNFVGVTKIPAYADANETGTYQYQYAVQPADKEKIIFRLKQTEKNGTVKYSVIRVVDIGNKTAEQPLMYPNPAKGYTNLLFSNNKRSDWVVAVFSISGQLVHEYHFANTLQARLNTGNELGKGMYIVKITDKKTEEKFVQQLVIQ